MKAPACLQVLLFGCFFSCFGNFFNCVSNCISCCSCLFLCEAFAAINRSVFAGLEGNFCNAAAFVTGSFEPFAFAATGVLACITASLAALRFVYETFFSIEFLFACCEYEFCAAFLAFECFVFVHEIYLF